MKAILWTTVAALLVAGTSVGSWYLYRNLTRPNLKRLGDTVLVYDVDKDKLPDDYNAYLMAKALKRRVDPADVNGITVVPLSNTRMEIRIPDDGNQSARVQRIKQLIAQVGTLEFRILANEEDDGPAINEAFAVLQDSANQAELQRRARAGLPPLPPARSPDGAEGFETALPEGGRCTYSWVELSQSECRSLGLVPGPQRDRTADSLQKLAAEAREKNRPFVDAVDYFESASRKVLLYSRKCQNTQLTQSEQADKAFDYYVLTRDPAKDKAVTGKDLERVFEGLEGDSRYSVSIRFSVPAGDRFHELTTQNLPTGPDKSRFYRHLAIILNGQVMSSPRLLSAIRQDVQITGNYTSTEVEILADILRSGALPAPLKLAPVSETTVQPNDSPPDDGSKNR